MNGETEMSRRPVSTATYRACACPLTPVQIGWPWTVCKWGVTKGDTGLDNALTFRCHLKCAKAFICFRSHSFLLHAKPGRMNGFTQMQAGCYTSVFCLPFSSLMHSLSLHLIASFVQAIRLSTLCSRKIWNENVSEKARTLETRGK